MGPIFLPTVSYMAESPDGYIASLQERFVQAKRHSYGVVELGYVLLQYVQLMRTVGFKLPLTTHWQIISLGWRMFTVHIFNTVHAFSLMCTATLMLPSFLSWIWSGAFLAMFYEGIAQGILNGIGTQFSGFVGWALCAGLGPVPPATFLTASTIFLVVLDLVEGRYALPPPPTAVEEEANIGEAVVKTLSTWERFKLAASLHADMSILGEPTIVLYGMIPELLAAWTLLRQSNFEYVVGAKPVGADGNNSES